MAKQRTISKSISLEGKGLHTGIDAVLTFNPAPANHGFVFQRTDLEGTPTIKADVDFVVDTSRGTTIAKNGTRVHTIEHLLAALAGLQLDNVLIKLTGPEVPIMDGSSAPFIEALIKAGIIDQDAERNYIKLPQNISMRDSDKNVDMLAVPADDFEVDVMVDYNSQVLGTQHASMKNISDFEKEISGARTFCFLHEIEGLVKNNLIKGGDLDNAIVVVEKKPDEETLLKLKTLFGKNDVQVKEGYLTNTSLRYENEPARHKLLDVVGDLALIGFPVKAKIVGSRPGHSTNVAFAKKIKTMIKEMKNGKMAPFYDPNIPPVYDIRMIERSLPHKYPFLLVDKIIELDDKHVVGVKNVTFNENFFQGHFPGNPVMPGVLQIEAMAQTGGILVLNTVNDPENWDTYFLKIDNARFKSKVIPGDTLIMKLELLSPIRRGICEMRGQIFVGNKVVTEADLVAQIVRKQPL
ncbi:MAG TPA: UDP-3-O-[3-hydroxymyristoyl] N-acetylglucosamine deacetylase [Bacteroidetes bacterium]|nr:UDP-3-O-[3-hydroxymyristoyl] N-acetylglucosamine deacetylase [Bacteroidota bacterium]